MIVPDAVEPILAYRTWLVVKIDDMYALRSMYVKVYWPAQKKFFYSGSMLLNRIEHHPTGIHAWKTAEAALRHVRDVYPMSNYPEEKIVAMAMGEVLLWGEVHEHERGYRARIAYPGHIIILHSYGSKKRELEEIVKQIQEDYKVKCSRHRAIIPERFAFGTLALIPFLSTIITQWSGVEHLVFKFMVWMLISLVLFIAWIQIVDGMWSSWYFHRALKKIHRELGVKNPDPR